MFKQIYEHLKTKKKYNTLLIQKETIAAELEKAIIELNTQRRINKIEREKFEQATDDYIKKLQKEKNKKKVIK